MARISIDEENKITQISWEDSDGEVKYIELNNNSISLHSNNGCESIINKPDVTKLLKALSKAKELGWWKE